MVYNIVEVETREKNYRFVSVISVSFQVLGMLLTALFCTNDFCL
jgi:hypothetical protein